MGKHVDKLFKPIQKAGFVITGLDKDNEPAVIVPYSEGRYTTDDGKKFYALPKGTREELSEKEKKKQGKKKEDWFDTALRETKEETGIDMELLFTKKQLDRLRRGKTIKSETPEGIPTAYDDVFILNASGKAIHQQYLSRREVPRDLAMFHIEVKGIENLRKHLKNPPNSNGEEHTLRTTQDLLKERKINFPPLADFQIWLSEGEMPIREWNRHKSDVVTKMKPLHKNGADGKAYWYKDVAAVYKHKHPNCDMTNWETWRDFCLTLDHENYTKLKEHIDQIKDQLKKLKILVGDDDVPKLKSDEDVLKMDDKEYIFRPYQEGAVIRKEHNFVSGALHHMDVNEAYKRGFGGNCLSQQSLDFGERIRKSQMAGILPFFKVEAIVKGVDEYLEQRTGGKNEDRESLLRGMMKAHAKIGASASIDDWVDIILKTKPGSDLPGLPG